MLPEYRRKISRRDVRLYRAYGSFLDTAGSELDDGIATVFRAPHSYTGEDTVEFSCHGDFCYPPAAGNSLRCRCSAG
ncbi:MAG: hypothetical protein ACLSFT_12130 [Ruminococcus callidus]